MVNGAESWLRRLHTTDSVPSLELACVLPALAVLVADMRTTTDLTTTEAAQVEVEALEVAEVLLGELGARYWAPANVVWSSEAMLAPGRGHCDVHQSSRNADDPFAHASTADAFSPKPCAPSCQKVQ